MLGKKSCQLMHTNSAAAVEFSNITKFMTSLNVGNIGTTVLRKALTTEAAKGNAAEYVLGRRAEDELGTSSEDELRMSLSVSLGR